MRISLFAGISAAGRLGGGRGDRLRRRIAQGKENFLGAIARGAQFLEGAANGLEAKISGAGTETETAAVVPM